jgi:phosphate transport system permease protein
LLVKMAGWQFSLAGGAIALTIIMLPYVVRGTDLALESVPRELREGGFALGATYTTVLMTVSWPYALPSVFTMLLLATGIALGETAPLIYTAGWSNYLPTLHPTHSPVPYLTYVIWTFISQPFAESHALAFAAAAILMMMIVVTNVFARSWLENLARKQRGERS